MGYSVIYIGIACIRIDTVAVARDTIDTCINILPVWNMRSDLGRIEQVACMAILTGFYPADVVSMDFRRSAVPVAGITGIIQVIYIVYPSMHAAIQVCEIYIGHAPRRGAVAVDAVLESCHGYRCQGCCK